MSFSPDEVRDRSLKAKRELDAAARSKRTASMLDAAAKAKQKSLHEDTEHLGSLIAMVANQEFSGAADTINDLLNTRVVNALDSYKQSVAKNMFGMEAPPSLEESHYGMFTDAGNKKVHEIVKKHNKDKKNKGWKDTSRRFVNAVVDLRKLAKHKDHSEATDTHVKDKVWNALQEENE